MKKLLSMVMITVLCVSLCAFSLPITVHADAGTLTAGDLYTSYTIEETINNVLTQVTYTAEQFLALLASAKTAVALAGKNLVMTVGGVVKSIPLTEIYTVGSSASLVAVGAFGAAYSFSQGAKWVANTTGAQREETLKAIGLNILNSYDLYNSDTQITVASIIANVLSDASYYHSYGATLTDTIIMAIAPLVHDYMGTAQVLTSIQAVGASNLTYIPTAILGLMTPAQFADAFSGTHCLTAYASSRYYLYETINRTTGVIYDSYVVDLSTQTAYPYNSTTHQIATGSMNNYCYQTNTSNTAWQLTHQTSNQVISPIADAETLMRLNWVFAPTVYEVASIADLTGAQVGTMDIPTTAIDTETMDITTTLDEDTDMVIDLDAVIAGDDSIALENEVPLPSGGGINVGNWFPITALTSIWHYVVSLVNAGVGFIGYCKDYISCMPVEISTPIWGCFVLAIFGGILFKLLK